MPCICRFKQRKVSISVLGEGAPSERKSLERNTPLGLTPISRLQKECFVWEVGRILLPRFSATLFTGCWPTHPGGAQASPSTNPAAWRRSVQLNPVKHFSKAAMNRQFQLMSIGQDIPDCNTPEGPLGIHPKILTQYLRMVFQKMHYFLCASNTLRHDAVEWLSEKRDRAR